MQVFVTINNVGIIINADVNLENWLTNVYVIKNLSHIIWNHSKCECGKLCDVGENLGYKNWKCRKS